MYKIEDSYVNVACIERMMRTGDAWYVYMVSGDYLKVNLEIGEELLKKMKEVVGDEETKPKRGRRKQRA